MHILSIQSLMQTSNVGFGTSGARGLVSDMSDTLCYAYTKAFLQAVVGKAGPVVLGHDLRPSSPRMAAACAAAMQDMGYTTLYAGALPTPALAFYASSLNAPCLVVTGSHIPFDRNGLKFYRAEGEISKHDEALMREAVVSVPSEIKPFYLSAADNSSRMAFVRRYLDFFGAQALAGMRVAVYEHSSVARDVLLDILQGLGAEVLSLGRTDTFVPIDTEAVRLEDVIQAKLWSNEHAFDAILSSDGDGDRPLIGDESGQWLRGDLVGVLCAMYLKADTVVTPLSSNTALELCGAFSQVTRTRIGSPYVIAGMEQADTIGNVVGFEANGGFLLGSDIHLNGRTLTRLPTRDAVLPMLALLCMARELGVPISKLSHSLPKRYTASDRLQQFDNQKSKDLIAQFSKDLNYAASRLAPDSGDIVLVNTVDGLRLNFTNGDIVHLRPSGNAPELRCYAEADTALRAQCLCDEALNQVKNL
ncbi:{ManB} Phosphomannomutase [Methylophilaceae bacterium]